MKQLLEMLKSAGKIQILIIAAVLCTLLVLSMDDGKTSTGSSEEEQRMERLLSRLEGAGKVSVMISEQTDGTKSGIVVASPGADDIRVMLELQRAAQTLTGLELERIEIVKSKGS